MKIPAQAFAYIHPSDMAPGQLFKFRGGWALRVLHGEDRHGFLMLEGERAGSVFDLTPGMVRSLAIVEPFGWLPMVAGGDTPSADADIALTLTLTKEGPVIGGTDARDTWDRTYIAFGLDGHGVEIEDLHRAMRFERWSVELCHRDRPFSSLGVLLELDRRQSQDHRSV